MEASDQGQSPEQNERERQDAERAEAARVHREQTAGGTDPAETQTRDHEEPVQQTDQPAQAEPSQTEPVETQPQEPVQQTDDSNLQTEQPDQPVETRTAEEPPSPAGEEPRVDGAPDLSRAENSSVDTSEDVAQDGVDGSQDADYR